MRSLSSPSVLTLTTQPKPSIHLSKRAARGSPPPPTKTEPKIIPVRLFFATDFGIDSPPMKPQHIMRCTFNHGAYVAQPRHAPPHLHNVIGRRLQLACANRVVSTTNKSCPPATDHTAATLLFHTQPGVALSSTRVGARFTDLHTQKSNTIALSRHDMHCHISCVRLFSSAGDRPTTIPHLDIV